MVVLAGPRPSPALGDRRDRARHDRRAQPARRHPRRSLGATGWIWTYCTSPASQVVADPSLYVLYPLIPWVGVMAVGYALGRVFSLDQAAPAAPEATG